MDDHHHDPIARPGLKQTEPEDAAAHPAGHTEHAASGEMDHALMIAATAGDVPISLGVAAGAERLVGTCEVERATPRGMAAMLGL